MRYNSVATLYTETVEADSHGNMKPVKGEPNDVFANKYTIGASTFMAAQEAGLHADAEIELRSVDYNGENIAVFEDVEYTVENVSDYGDFVRLTLARRLSNA